MKIVICRTFYYLNVIFYSFVNAHNVFIIITLSNSLHIISAKKRIEYIGFVIILNNKAKDNNIN